MNSDLADQLTKGITNCICFSLQFDEFVDVVDISQPCIFVRMDFQDMSIKEEILTILPLKKKTRGEDVYCDFKKYIEEKNIPFYKVVSMTTDGVPSITDTVNGFLAICMRDDDFSHFLSYHCIIHQQALCCKILNMRHVMGICMKIVNSIRGRSLQRRIFRAHLEENESDYGELLYHADVLWLSRSIFLQRFRDLPQEGIPTTLNRKILMEDRRQLEWIIGFPQSMRLSVDDIFHYWKLTKTGICDQHDASSRNVLPHTPTKGENKHVGQVFLR
ncbi:general transcription factor II-I repeat domain-containing protein 2A [Trichonephila clavipes]|nr:general transcription factor II-I repeat domain-containing protein 2A [Trichonephila clavipes]GFV01343.1 general transcription factor II-I repeat domain-containing protein 2A [Trichonephila clavipes]